MAKSSVLLTHESVGLTMDVLPYTSGERRHGFLMIREMTSNHALELLNRIRKAVAGGSWKSPISLTQQAKAWLGG